MFLFSSFERGIQWQVRYVESQTQSYLREDITASTCRLLFQWLYPQCFNIGHAELVPYVSNSISNTVQRSLGHHVQCLRIHWDYLDIVTDQTQAEVAEDY